jgi:hypothetical protein
MSKPTVMIECIPGDEAGVFRVSIHDESGDWAIFSQSAAKPNCAPVFSGLGSENLALGEIIRTLKRRHGSLIMSATITIDENSMIPDEMTDIF